MNFLKKAAFSLAAGSLAIAPVVASAAQPLAAVSFDDSRLSSDVDAANLQDGGKSSWVIALLAGAAIILGIVLLADGGDNSPTSP